MIMPHADARHTCDKLIASLRNSELNFLIQETPFSAFITIRKTFFRGSNKSGKNPVLETNDVKCEKLEHENEMLKTLLKDKDLQLESFKKESRVQQERLKRAENDISKHCDDAKAQEAKLADEISKLKSEISSLKSKSSDANKMIKAHEKNVHNLEKKNEHLIEQKNSLKIENLEFTKEIKVLKKKTAQQVKSKSLTTQTESFDLSCLCLDNNNSITNSLMSMSTSTQTSMELSGSSPVVSTLASSSTATQSIKCLVCAKICDTADDLVTHAGAEHDLSIDVEKLSDLSEDDDFLRFLKSMNTEEDYLKERVKYYPENSDHVYERIKIRILAQIKFLSWSKTIERNMEDEYYKTSCYKGTNRET